MPHFPHHRRSVHDDDGGDDAGEWDDFATGDFESGEDSEI